MERSGPSNASHSQSQHCEGGRPTDTKECLKFERTAFAAVGAAALSAIVTVAIVTRRRLSLEQELAAVKAVVAFADNPTFGSDSRA